MEVAHEALFRHWAPLRQEIEVHAEELQWRADLERWALDWERSGRQDAYLLRAERLKTARQLVASAEDLASDVSWWLSSWIAPTGLTTPPASSYRRQSRGRHSAKWTTIQSTACCSRSRRSRSAHQPRRLSERWRPHWVHRGFAVSWRVTSGRLPPWTGHAAGTASRRCRRTGPPASGMPARNASYWSWPTTMRYGRWPGHQMAPEWPRCPLIAPPASGTRSTGSSC